MVPEIATWLSTLPADMVVGIVIGAIGMWPISSKFHNNHSMKIENMNAQTILELKAEIATQKVQIDSLYMKVMEEISK